MFGTLDLGLLCLYLAFLLVIGIRQLARPKPAYDDYLVMGRRLALPGFVASIVSSWYGGILGVGEYSYRYGLSNWVIFGLPYYLGAFLFAIFLAGRARKAAVYTIPDQLEKAYGRKTSLAGALLVFITTVPAAYVLQVGFLGQTVLGIPLAYGVAAGAVFSIFYVFTGGLRSDVITDRLQFILMFSGFALMVGFMAATYGGIDFISAGVPSANLTLTGGRPITYILVWYFIALGTLVDPSFYQRCFAAKSEAVARRGILIAILFWAFFDFMTTATGLYARAIIPGLADPATSYPMLAAKVLPDFFRAIFLLGLFATVMSTIDSFTLVAGQTIGKDFIHKLWGGDITTLTRIGLVLAGAMAVLIAIFKRSVVEIWYDLGSISTASLLIPLATSFSKKWRMKPNCAFAATVAGAMAVLVWMGLAHFSRAERFARVDPIYPGLACAIAIYLFDRLGRSR